MQVLVKNIIQSTIAAFHNEGLLVYPFLERAYSNKEPITISFEGIDRCATQFLNASIGKMYLQFDPSMVDSLVSYSYGGLHNLAAKIEEVRENAINSKEYDSLIENATA